MVSNEQHGRIHSGDSSPAELTAADWVARYQAEIGHAPPTASALMSFSRNRGGSVNYKTTREALAAALGSSPPLVAVPTGTTPGCDPTPTADPIAFPTPVNACPNAVNGCRLEVAAVFVFSRCRGFPPGGRRVLPHMSRQR